jgi:hypothetical protein
MTSIASRLTIVTTRSPLFLEAGRRKRTMILRKTEAKSFSREGFTNWNELLICVIDLPDAASAISARTPDVRFPPDSGGIHEILKPPLRAISGSSDSCRAPFSLKPMTGRTVGHHARHKIYLKARTGVANLHP